MCFSVDDFMSKYFVSELNHQHTTVACCGSGKTIPKTVNNSNLHVP